MSEEDRRRFQQVGGYGQFRRQYPDLLRPAEGCRPTADDDLLKTQFVVTAYKMNRDFKDAGLHVFGPFASEEEAQIFFTKVIEHPDWDAEEVPTLNRPEVFGTGDERL